MEKQSLLQQLRKIVVSKRESKPTSTGGLAEYQALQHLQQHGLSLVAQNFHCRFGEIDIIMQDDDCIVFVEVRFRKNPNYGMAIETVTATKQQKIQKSAQYYLQKEKLGDLHPIRFDVVGIDLGGIHWVKNAF